ncbi:AraC family transcriptional regulator [Paenibacillus filicis]|uniref:AraC family transcriptional regulator n=1 Tax=Paenibacillus filicis TaxID=669464 RepID=A0ABU9DVA2_9BACL
MRIMMTGYSKHTRSFYSPRTVSGEHYLLRLQTEGFCQAALNGTVYDIVPGDLLMCKPGDRYELNIPLEELHAHPSADYYLGLDANEPWAQQWWGEFKDTQKLNIGIDEMLISMWKLLIHETRKVKDSDADILDYLARSLLLHMKRLIAGGDSKNRYERSVSNQIKSFVEKNVTEAITLREVSASVGLSVSRASQIFKQTFGQSIMDYAIEVRLSLAKEQMLIGCSTLQEIAYLCGFANYTHFNRLFHSRYKMSPSDYRKQLRPFG